MALGYQAVAKTANTISFGHVAGDTYYSADPWDHIISTNTFKDTYYNRLVNVADGIDDHDVVVMEQLKNAKAEAVAEAKTNIKVKGDEFNVHAAESTDAKGVQTTTISLLPKVTLKESTDTTGSKAVVLDGTAGTISAGLSADTANRISLNGTTGLANIGAITIGKQNDYSYTYYAPVYDSQGNMTISSTRATESGKFITGLTNTEWTPGKYASGRAATEDQLEQAGRHFLSINGQDANGKVKENTLANYYNDGATGANSMAFGVGTKSSGALSISMGINSTASGLGALAVGYNSVASGTESVALGTQNNASGNYSVAVGLGAEAGTKNTDATSTDNGAAVAVGFMAFAQKTGAAAYGYSATADGVESSAFGTSANATAEGGVALGAHSVANRSKGETGYLAPTVTIDNASIWVSTSGALSLGGTDAAGTKITRQITNLAAGSEDLDAVNVAQLKAVESKGMNFQGNDTTTSVHLDQGGTLQLQGSGRKDDKEYSTQNVKVLTDTANNRLSIVLDKNPDFDSVTAGTEGTSADGGQAGSVKIVGADSSNANKATTITAGYAALPELSGTNGTGRISYTDGDGTAHTVATLGDGLKFAGDTGTASVALDKTLDVKGGATDLATGNNIGVTANGSALSLKLAKDITGLDTVTAGGAKLGKQTDGNDTTKSGDYLTGLDNTTWKVGETKAVTGRAATEDQLKSVSDVVSSNKTQIAANTETIAKGLNFQANTKGTDGSYKTVNRALGSTVAVRAHDAQSDHTYKTDNLTTEINDNGIITVKMDTRLTADKVTVGKDGNAVTIDGSNGSLTTGSSTLNGTGLTIKNGPSVTTSGINGGSKQITDVASGATRNDAAGKPVYETDKNGANIGDVKNIAAKMVTVSGDGKNTNVVGAPNPTDGTVDYKVSLSNTVTLGSAAGKQVSLNGTTGVIKAGNQATIDGSAGTASIGNLSLGTVAANTLTLKDKDGKDTTKKADAGTYATGLTNTTWDVANPSYVSGRAATEDELLTVSNTVNSGWKAQINGTDVKNVTPTDNTLNFVAGDNIELSSGSDIKISTAKDVNFNTVRIGGTNNNGTYTGGIYIGSQPGGGANSVTGFYITGLSNTNWDENNIVDDRAATEAQLKKAINHIQAGTVANDNYVTEGTTSDDTDNPGKMKVTLKEHNGDTVNVSGLHDYYVTGGSVLTATTTTDGVTSTTATLNLTKNNGDTVTADLTGLSKMDYHLVENSASGSDGKYTIDANGDVKLTVASDTDTVGKEITISGLASKADVVKGLTFTASALADGATSLTHTAQLGDSIGIFGGNKQDGHTYNTNNITTTIDARGDIRVLMDDNLVVGSKDTGVDGSVKATGQGGAYLKMNGADGSLRMGDASGNFAALIQNYGSDGTAFLNSSEKGSPRLQYWAAKSGQSESDAAKTLHTIATLDDGMKFAGDDAKTDPSKTISTTLNSTLNITGGAATGGLTDGNIGVVKNDAGDGLEVKLNKDLSNMGTISFAPEAGKQGIKIGSQNVGTSGKGTNAQTGDYVTGLTNTKWNADDIVSGRAATEDQLQNVAKSIVNGSATGGGFGLSADNADSTKATEVKQDLGKAIKITTGGDNNLSITVDSANKAIVVALNKDLNLNKATFTDGASGATTVVDGKGIAITPQNGSTDSQVKLTTDGLSNGGKQITNVLSGLNGTELAKAEGDTLNHAATIGDLKAAAKGATDMADAKGLNFEGNTETKIHTNLGDTLKIQGTGAANRDYDGGANVRVVADDKTNTLMVQLDRDLDAHTMTLGKASTADVAGELGTLKINGQNKDGGISPVSINATYTDTTQDTKTALKTAMSRVTYDGGNGHSHTVATLDDGLQLSGDNGEAANTTLNKKVTIKGGVSKDKLVDNTTDPTKNNNIGVVASQDNDGNTTLSLQLAKDLTGLNTVTAGTVVMGNQTVNTKLHPTEETGNFVKGLSNTNWSGTDDVSGRAATEDQLYTVSQSIQDTVKGATFAITAGGQGEATDATVTKKVGESIRIFGDAPKVSGGGDGWDRSAANILTKVKKDNHGDGYVSVELQDHLEVGVHAGTDTDGKAIDGTDGSMQFKGKAASNEVMVTGDTGVTLKNNGNQAAALHQTDGTGYLDLAGSQGAFTSLFAQQGEQNMTSNQDSKSDTRLTYTDKNSKTAHQVATLDDGLIVAGDNGQVTRLLNSTLKLSGGETDTTKLSNGKNIGVVANKDNDGLDIKLAKDLTDIDSINMTGGLKLNSTNGSSTITGLTNTSVDLPDFGKAGRAATEEQLEQVKGSITDAAKGGGFGLADDKGNAVKADLGSNIGIHGDSNITTAVSEDGKSLNIGLKKDVDLGDAGSIKAGGVTIDKNGIDAGGKNITNVKSGIVKGDDSDNGNAANIGDVKHIVDGKIGDVNGKIDNITKDVSNIKTDVSTIKQTKRTYQGDDGKTVNIDFGGALSLTGGATEVAEDKNIGVVKNGENGLSLRLAKNLGGLESVTTGKTTMDDSGLTIAGSDGKAGTTVTNSGIKIASSGDDTHAVEISNSNVSMGGQQIHGVAPGSADDDAVNVSQLKKSVGALGGAINQVDRRVDRVGAGAAALAALHPQDFDPDDKWDFAVGYGNYRGANAAAVGAFYKPNEDTTFSVGGTVGGGENMVNAGISFKFGQGNHVSNSRVAMAKEIKDLRKEVESLRSALVDVAAGKQLDPAKTKLFPDMPKNHWAYKEISELAGNGLLDGYPDGEFKGDRMMTRYEFATIVYRQMMAGRELSDRLVQEFEPELERIRIDVVARHKDGTPSIERVRVNKSADANRK